MKYQIHFPVSLLSALLVALICCSSGNQATAQDYWEYDRWEDEWEHHYPTAGIEYEYEDDGDVEAEAEQYEWEPGEGYHEQEWYDPSDWFEAGRDIDYESDAYDDYYYDDDYSYYTDDWEADETAFDRWYWWP